MAQVTFTVYARAQPKGSTRAFVKGGVLDMRRTAEKGSAAWLVKPRAVTTSANENLKAYNLLIGLAARDALIAAGLEWPMAGRHVPVGLDLVFTFERPPSCPAGRMEMVVPPDKDKCERGITDALAGWLYVNDAQVVEGFCRKCYGSVAGVTVSAYTL